MGYLYFSLIQNEIKRTLAVSWFFGIRTPISPPRWQRELKILGTESKQQKNRPNAATANYKLKWGLDTKLASIGVARY